ncbi:M16 family metallopeptidase [Methylophaga lonarensis]|uniref:M16 family metallopeptidase n=1 Tax=Methylophaga lonarensis TaxID=999151 RepID=UPI003D2DC360
MLTRIMSFCALLITSVSVTASPNIQQWQSSNGTPVWFFEAPQLPMVDIRLVFDGGAARDADKSGLALLTNSMLNEGTASMNTDEIADAFANVGARYSASAERDMAVLSLRTLNEHEAMEVALDTFTQILTSPSFPEASFQRLRNQMLTGLQAERQSPGAIASRAFQAGIYAEDHPYASMPAGHEQTLADISLEDIQAFYQRYYVAANAVVVIVGDLDRRQAEALAEQLLADLPKGTPADPLPVVAELSSGVVNHIEHPSSQTHIMVGQPGMTRHDPDYFPLYVGNHIFGGSGLVSLLSGEIREKRGLSYASYSFFRPMREAGPFQMVLQTRNDQAQEAHRVMMQTLSDFIENGPTQEQLEAAQQNITGGFALRLDSNSKIADYLAMMAFYQLPDDHLSRFNERVNAVTVEQIRDAFQRRLAPSRMLTVMVGGKTE